MVRFIGFDPGACSGALAVLDEAGGLVALADLPTVLQGRRGTRLQVNGAALARWLEYRGLGSGDRAVVERVSARPGQGVSSAYAFGVSVGILHGVCAALGIPVVQVAAQTWKRRYGLLGAEKDAARSVAAAMWPTAELGLKRHQGRADALLMARWLLSQERGRPGPVGVGDADN